MRLGRTLGALVGFAMLALASASAWAQSVSGSATDYQVTQQTLSANYETEPSNATNISFGSLDDSVTAVPLAFTFPFFGTNYSGNVNVVLAFPSQAAGESITATVTNSSTGDTSEFSDCAFAP